MNEEDITQFEEALENLPDEVKDFLYGDEYQKALQSIAETHDFTEEQKSQFDLTLTDVICLLQPKDALIELFTSWGFSQEKQALLVKDIEEKIFMPIIEATNYIVEYEDETEEEKTQRNTSDPYIEIQKRFVYGTPIVRAEKKSYSFDKLPTPPRPEGNTPSQSTDSRIDPYRERPE
jgi:hypothetical protein